MFDSRSTFSTRQAPDARCAPAPETSSATARDGSGLAGCDGGCSFQRVGSAERPEIQAFIRRGFERAYRARITHFMPGLIRLRRDSRLVAACGLRSAASEALFLETYLDRPIEQALAVACSTPPARGAIAEVGNLVAAGPGDARRLIVHLTHYLRSGPARWVVFTGVAALRNSFRRLGIPLHALGAADGARLDARARADWGTYYEQAPVVTAVEVAAASEAVRGMACTR